MIISGSFFLALTINLHFLNEANRNPNLEDGNANVFSVEEIRQHVLNGFPLEIVLPVLRGHILENRDNEPLELLDNETNIPVNKRRSPSLR